MHIGILCPTRKRPQNMERLWKSAYEMADQQDMLHIFWYVDDDDFDSYEMGESLQSRYPNNHIVSMVGPRNAIKMSEMSEYLFQAVRDTYQEIELFFLAGDDIVFRTPNWDTEFRKVFASYNDRIVLVGGEDGYNPDILTHFMMHKRVADILGYLSPAGYSGDYTDTHMNDIFRKINRVVRLNNVLIEHMHWSAGKASMDQTNSEKNTRCYSGSEPAHVMYKNREQERVEAAKKLAENLE